MVVQTLILEVRGDATVIYIDGVRTIGSTNLPKSALDQVTVVTGGTPAEYGKQLVV